MTYAHRMINDPKSSQFITWTELGTRSVPERLTPLLARSHIRPALASSYPMWASSAAPSSAPTSSTTTSVSSAVPWRVSVLLTPPPPAVLELRPPAEHVRLPQDQPRKRSSSGTVRLPARGLTPLYRRPARSGRPQTSRPGSSPTTSSCAAARTSSRRSSARRLSPTRPSSTASSCPARSPRSSRPCARTTAASWSRSSRSARKWTVSSLSPRPCTMSWRKPAGVRPRLFLTGVAR